MKRRLLFISAFIFSLGSIYAQGEMDAYKLSRNGLTGTARSVAMGGAFGALGGDVSGIKINPAGIGVYTKTEIVTTLNFQNAKTSAEMNLGKLDESKFKFSFDNLAFVSSLQTYNDVAPYLNFGFSFNRLKNFNRKFTSDGENMRNSLTDYMAAYSTSQGFTPYDLSLKDNDDAWGGFNTWLPVFGYNAFLINEDPVGSNKYSSLAKPEYANLFWQEKGYIDSYDFNFGTTFADKLSVGLTVSVTDIDYHIYSSYIEEYGVVGGYNNYYELQNWTKTEGGGYQVSAGLIYKPIDELRIGVSYHSPTWYNMTDYYEARLDHDITDIVSNSEYKSGWIGSPNGVYDYKMYTPDKWTFSLAGVIGQTAIISADYELTNYKNMKLKHRDSGLLDWNPNPIIKDDFKTASTLRVGAEVRFTPQFSGRVGYVWMQSPLNKNFKRNMFEVETVGSIPHYILEGDTNYFTYGLGYRFTKNFYSDIAFVMSTQKADLYYFPKMTEMNVIPDKSELKTNTFQGLLTLGYKF